MHRASARWEVAVDRRPLTAEAVAVHLSLQEVPIEIRRAYKTELDPTLQQRRSLIKHVGAARWAYNWGLNEKTKAGGSAPAPSAIELHRRLNALKKTQFPWLYEVSKCAPQEALRDLDRAFRNFRRVDRRGRRAGFPRFKSRKRGLGSCRLTGSLVIAEGWIQLPRLGRLRLKERGYLPVAGVNLLSATIAERAGRWFVSVQVVQDIPTPQNHGPAAGVDLGVLRLATVSDGATFPSPRTLPRLQRKLRRAQRAISRKKRGSRNRARAARKAAVIYARVANARSDLLHKVTSHLTRTKSLIGIEDLNAAGMLKNRCLARVVSEAAFGRFRTFLEYKARWYGASVVVADRMFPSSKTCSLCGHRRDDLPLSVRMFRCLSCQTELDRDLNAALNLLAVAVSCTDTKNACEEVIGPPALAAGLAEAGTGSHARERSPDNGPRPSGSSGQRSGHRNTDPGIPSR